MDSEFTAKRILECFKRGGTVFFCGNGGSAAQANHFAAEFVCKYKKNRKPFNALSLCSNQSVITAIGNDYGFEYIFSRQLEAHGKKGDLLIPLSTSYKSENILQAEKMARKLGIVILRFPNIGKDVGQRQDNHSIIAHDICRQFDKLVPTGSSI